MYPKVLVVFANVGEIESLKKPTEWFLASNLAYDFYPPPGTVQVAKMANKSHDLGLTLWWQFVHKRELSQSEIGR